MWENSEHLTISGLARPLRVAYLVDLERDAERILDAIFAEAYGRWGGRRTLVVPVLATGIDSRYLKWLYVFDADIIYSFADLSDEAVAYLHETCGPAHLIKHRELSAKTGEVLRYDIQLPISSLLSLSVLPAFRARSWGFEGPPRDIKVLETYWDGSDTPFLRENFGFPFISYSNSEIAKKHPDLFTSTTLIGPNAYSDPMQGKDAHATYLTSESDVLSALGQAGGPLTLAQISDWFSPSWELCVDLRARYTHVVVGDSVDDRLAFWNVYQRLSRPSFWEIGALRIPKSYVENELLFSKVAALILQRGMRGHDGCVRVCLMSCSMDEECLGVISDRLKRSGISTIETLSISSHAVVVPPLNDQEKVTLHTGGMFAEPIQQVSAEFSSSRAPVPAAAPWHMTEAVPPAGLRHGQWMIDLTVDRALDHGRFDNQRDVWIFPRRIRLERAVRIDRDPTARRVEAVHSLRVIRTGSLALANEAGAPKVSISLPEDLAAIRRGLCETLEWVPFDRARSDRPRGRVRVAHAEVSDKGRYLMGVIGMFDSLSSAFNVLMNEFWREELQRLGGVPAEKATDLRNQLIKRLRRKFSQPSGPLNFSDDDAIERLATEALRAGRMIDRERRYVSYGQLRRRWGDSVEAFLAEASDGTEDPDADAYYRDDDRLARSLQRLCQCEVLFQGRDWRCPRCFNRNWIGIEALSRTMTCAVCAREEPASVKGDWQFRANSFLVEAYRDHGTEAAIWALWRLWKGWSRSFYYAPSLRLWRERPANDRTADIEVDAIVVVDGRVHLVEAKSAAKLDSNEIDQLITASKFIRPDVLVIACMDAETDGLKRAVEKLRSKLEVGVEVQLLTFDPGELEPGQFLS
ncbi:hypothetical protein GCM10007301_22800 [Azorhizobium oxalatiphilum]|uniref:Uncharacterized protein n=1 Tax=Azorhizobium oxalatiphilum TaxID=980631 RepID=A0A917BY38_9HYPH|nr:hypothetical protein [Azorhizobium oxalatiphilum]GGF62519.1 hypothetical protein GCM10007301_22800 [Azorhizobium oxalatiphilum]